MGCCRRFPRPPIMLEAIASCHGPMVRIPNSMFCNIFSLYALITKIEKNTRYNVLQFILALCPNPKFHVLQFILASCHGPTGHRTFTMAQIDTTSCCHTSSKLPDTAPLLTSSFCGGIQSHLSIRRPFERGGNSV
ncbi:hypothetical protein L2E82_30757 [Cichorium intybus]|uniref:Uncharacterized protein n=1 Tax=Cichorium intybus TaxID=13427 RepID=A0ACB9D189_CICIN|nr:hypothetical protein L2E82_30757 [Cichorium intybus]